MENVTTSEVAVDPITLVIDVPVVKPKRNSDKRPLKDDYIRELSKAQIEVKRLKVIIDRHHEGNVFTRIVRAIRNKQEVVSQ